MDSVPPGFAPLFQGEPGPNQETRVGIVTLACDCCKLVSITFPYHPFCIMHAPCGNGRHWKPDSCSFCVAVINHMFKFAETKRVWFYNIRSYLRKMQMNNLDPWIFKTPYFYNIQAQIMGHDYNSDDSLVDGQGIDRSSRSPANESSSSTR